MTEKIIMQKPKRLRLDFICGVGIYIDIIKGHFGDITLYISLPFLHISIDIKRIKNEG